MVGGILIIGVGSDEVEIIVVEVFAIIDAIVTGVFLSENIVIGDIVLGASVDVVINAVVDVIIIFPLFKISGVAVSGNISVVNLGIFIV